MIRLAIAEDHNSLVDGVKLFLRHEDDIQLVGSATNGVELCKLAGLKQPNVIITDIRMPIMDGIAATQKILLKHPQIKIIAFTMFDQDDAVNQMLAAGAKGYVLKNSSLKDLLVAVRTVYNGGTYYDGSLVLSEIATAKAPVSPLSKRQIEILKLIALGNTNQEIADTLFIGKTTVETHRKNMIRILNLQGSGELLRYALESKYRF
ncbi:response regulator transcription factor [Arenibacter sp. GZD96]|uniref:response regulator transcription factor n=1 Tax=Aurantibrevibacter litoralis TaxID=3106030 RepID=UPI002AFEFF00|nr:response regulator transcription factor [Arenibacter sp. GZD-96]MEA1785812.1 response regulator transcription factor [Arenibacter sp. GZD-96]